MEESLESLLKDNQDKTLVSLMYANNEIGNLLDFEKVSQLCKTHQALFHSDTVQAFGHFPIDVQKVEVDFLSASAHKFHGPKGIGFLYQKKKSKVASFLHGGGQERGYRKEHQWRKRLPGPALTLRHESVGSPHAYWPGHQRDCKLIIAI